jgi:hypothetical protein
VTCRSCHATQLEAERATPFEHLPGCKESSAAPDPWSELDRICRGFQTTHHR